MCLVNSSKAVTVLLSHQFNIAAAHYAAANKPINQTPTRRAPCGGLLGRYMARRGYCSTRFIMLQ
jgi:hypothetical protein